MAVADEIVSIYFALGMSYQEILHLMAYHGHILSMRTLKRRLAKLNLYRRRNYSNILDVALFIIEKVTEPGFSNGYRWMHKMCLKNGYVVSRDTVSTLMSLLDPEGVELRKGQRLRRRQYCAKGPNYLWHLDSYDKLRRYGLCINGSIDGYSRYIIWTKVTNTSNDPRVIAGHFLDAVEKLEGCPSKIRGDRGTENGFVEQMQKFLTDDDNSFLYGRSTANQRIEMYWRHLRRQCIQLWIERMTQLEEENLYSGDLLDRNLVQFTFMDILQVNCQLLTSYIQYNDK